MVQRFVCGSTGNRTPFFLYLGSVTLWLALITIPPHGTATGRSPPCLGTQDEQQHKRKERPAFAPQVQGWAVGSCSGLDYNPYFPSPHAAKTEHQILVLEDAPTQHRPAAAGLCIPTQELGCSSPTPVQPAGI